MRFCGDGYIVVLAEADLDSAFFLDSNIPLENNLSVARLVLQNVGCELLSTGAVREDLELGARKACSCFRCLQGRMMPPHWRRHPARGRPGALLRAAV